MQSNARISGDPGAQQFADEFKRDYIDKGPAGRQIGPGLLHIPRPGLPPSRVGAVTPSDGITWMASKAQTEVCATVYESVNVDQHDLGQGQLAELAVGRPYAVYRGR